MIKLIIAAIILTILLIMIFDLRKKYIIITKKLEINSEDGEKGSIILDSIMRTEYPKEIHFYYDFLNLINGLIIRTAVLAVLYILSIFFDNFLFPDIYGFLFTTIEVVRYCKRKTLFKIPFSLADTDIKVETVLTVKKAFSYLLIYQIITEILFFISYI